MGRVVGWWSKCVVESFEAEGLGSASDRVRPFNPPAEVVRGGMVTLSP